MSKDFHKQLGERHLRHIDISTEAKVATSVDRQLIKLFHRIIVAFSHSLTRLLANEMSSEQIKIDGRHPAALEMKFMLLHCQQFVSIQTD